MKLDHVFLIRGSPEDNDVDRSMKIFRKKALEPGLCRSVVASAPLRCLAAFEVSLLVLVRSDIILLLMFIDSCQRQSRFVAIVGSSPLRSLISPCIGRCALLGARPSVGRQKSPPWSFSPRLFNLSSSQLFLNAQCCCLLYPRRRLCRLEFARHVGS